MFFRSARYFYRFSHTKILRIKLFQNIFENPLFWPLTALLQHFIELKRKLYHSLSSLNRIKHSIPEKLHKDLYFTLFESHLCYGISVWGGSPQSKLDVIHKIQKKVIRIMFGDTDAFKEKFMTCARSRDIDSQILGAEFYTKEHTKL